MNVDELENRNQQILALFDNGMSIVDLAFEFALPLPRVISLLRDRGRLTVARNKSGLWNDITDAAGRSRLSG